uniref:Protein kinase domain-containing protein n=1 Tax=viral metagenome TaxID=1070528 RepID=A0A6C0DTJ2_9ZZZZ
MVNINYQKRKNSELFKTLECYDFAETQNYIPIYNKFFSLNETNYNSVNLNHDWYLTNIKENIMDNKNLYNCTIKHQTTQKIKSKNVFFKLAPLIDPFKYLIGKYNPNDPKLYKLPLITSELDNFNSKFIDQNNASYVDSFFSFLNSRLIHKHNFIHGVDFYGSFLSIKNNFVLNIFDDIDYLNKSDYFNKNKNVLFQVDDYNFLFDEDEKSPKLPPIKIDHTNSLKSNISIKSIDDSMFENVFSDEIVSLETLKERSLDLVDVNDLQVQTNITTTLKSGSTCSSRSSYTENDDNSCCDKEENQNQEESQESDDDDENYEDCDSESNCNEERINAVIPKFPVQIICMEQCENTFDDLILNEELSEMEWYSAFMQIIMILITYQKMFAFTHNDLHTNNVMYNKTEKEFIYYCYKKKYYKVPTFGRIFKIIDFGRSIYKFDGKTFCSDSFQAGGDAATQYNTEPYFNDKKPRLEPNYSFDICRLACSIFDYMIEDLESIKNLDECEPVTKLIVEWCLDDKGVNLLYKNDGSDRYPDFKLYKMIARCVHNHTPQAQLERKEFSSFAISKNKLPESAKVMNLDEYPSYV